MKLNSTGRRGGWEAPIKRLKGRKKKGIERRDQVSREPFPSFCRRCCCRRRRRRSIIFCRRFTTCIYFRVWDKRVSSVWAMTLWRVAAVAPADTYATVYCAVLAPPSEYGGGVETSDSSRARRRRKPAGKVREIRRNIAFHLAVQGWINGCKTKIEICIDIPIHRLRPLRWNFAAAALVQMLCLAVPQARVCAQILICGRAPSWIELLRPTLMCKLLQSPS